MRSFRSNNLRLSFSGLRDINGDRLLRTLASAFMNGRYVLRPASYPTLSYALLSLDPKVVLRRCPERDGLLLPSLWLSSLLATERRNA